MTWTGERVLKQIELGEDSLVEFKEAISVKQRNTIADELAAMGNTRGGTLVFSVSDKGEVKPLSRKQMDTLEMTVSEICSDSIRPHLQFSTQRLSLPDDSSVLVVEVEKSRFVHKSPGGYFHRQGSTKREITPEVLSRLFEQRSRTGLIDPDERTVEGTGPNTLDPELSGRFLSSRTDEPRQSLLNKLGFVREDDDGVMRATVAGILLCTEKPEENIPDALIQAVRYRGNTPDGANQLDAATITGPLDRQIREAIAFAVRNMNVAARKDPARVDMPQYSERALFEAIVNAVIHRDYSMRGSRIRLFLFDDRLELYSPGALVNTLTTKNIGDRQSARNGVIVSMLGRLPVKDIRGSGERQYFLERRGEGVPIIRGETRALTGREPVYDLLDGAELRLTLPAAPQKGEGVQAEVLILAAGQPLAGIQVHVLYPNKTWKEEKTDTMGRAHFNFHSELPMTVFCASRGYAAHVERDWFPTTPLTVELGSLPGGGSIVFSEETGDFPGLKGRINPILDNLDRTYMYTTNIAIDGGKQQPVHFKLRQSLRLTDINGGELVVRVVEMIGKSALLEYEIPE